MLLLPADNACAASHRLDDYSYMRSICTVTPTEVTAACKAIDAAVTAIRELTVDNLAPALRLAGVRASGDEAMSTDDSQPRHCPKPGQK